MLFSLWQLHAVTHFVRPSSAVQLREKAAVAKEEAGGLAPLAHSVLEAQKEEQRRAAELAALKRSVFALPTVWTFAYSTSRNSLTFVDINDGSQKHQGAVALYAHDQR